MLAEEEVNAVVKKYGPLLRKGLNLSHHPNVNEVLKRNLPAPALTPGFTFLFFSSECHFLTFEIVKITSIDVDRRCGNFRTEVLEGIYCVQLQHRCWFPGKMVDE